MNILKNNLRKLEKDNDIEMSTIEDHNKKTVRDIVRYLSSSSLSLFEVQVIRKDLIGMALQSDMEHSKLRDKIGMDEKAFCDAIIENGRNHKWMEHLLRFVVFFFQVYAIVYTLEFILLYSAPAQHGIKVFSILWMFIWCILVVVIRNFIRNKLSVSTVRYKTLFSAIPVILAISSIKWLDSISIADMYILQGNGWVIGSVIILIAVFVTISENIFWNIISEKYSWKDNTPLPN